MSESVVLCTTRLSVAFALAFGLAAAAVVDGVMAASFSGGTMLGRAGPGGTGPGSGGASGNQSGVVPPARADIAGAARVIDGDTIEIEGQRIRLEGIDAPESGQTCARRFFGRWDCGAAATKALSGMVAGRQVACISHGNDKYGRMLGICHAGGIDINERMVSEGLAWAFVKYSQTYVAVEQQARSAWRGVFAADTEPAWDYRAHRWAHAEQTAPEGCAIKGNISRKGQIYHMPWSPWYSRVTVDPARGERWFCSEAEAAAAGWRPAHGS